MCLLQRLNNSIKGPRFHGSAFKDVIQLQINGSKSMSGIKFGIVFYSPTVGITSSKSALKKKWRNFKLSDRNHSISLVKTHRKLT